MRTASALATLALACALIACERAVPPAAPSWASTPTATATTGDVPPPIDAAPLTPQVAPGAAPASPPQPAHRTVLFVGKLLDVKTGKVATDQAITIEGDKIVAVTGRAQTKTEGATVIDLPKATALPGLVDAHVHLTLDLKLLSYPGLGVSLPREALFGARNARVTLEAGFTSVRNLGAHGYADVALKQAIDDGDVPGPRMDVSGPALSITGGHCDPDNLLSFDRHSDQPSGVADGVEQVQHKVREVIRFGATVIKVCATGGVLSKGDDPQASQYSLEELKAIVADAHRLGRRVAAHAHGAQGIRFSVEAGVDSIEHGTYMDDATVAAMKAKGTYLVPTLTTFDWVATHNKDLPPWAQAKAIQVHDTALKNVERAIKSGVKVALGTDAGAYPHGMNGRELGFEVKLGMTPLQAIQSGTLNSAALLGWSNLVGTLEPGKLADIIAVDGDPLTDVSTFEHVRFVMKGGTVYKNEYH
jgi:imidazolonepropionase-like amidohydrolase